MEKSKFFRSPKKYYYEFAILGDKVLFVIKKKASQSLGMETWSLLLRQQVEAGKNTSWPAAAIPFAYERHLVDDETVLLCFKRVQESFFFFFFF